tara:strand:+ start:2028 stop:2792 length:765 start_codon:yes stop_codon:yes gene_type:complete
MRKLLLVTFITLLLAGCGEDSKKPTEDSPESNQSSAETPTAKSPEVGGVDLDDNETLAKIIAGAIDGKKLKKGDNDRKLAYAPNEQTPYTGWVKLMHDNGQIVGLKQFKDGKTHGLATRWFENGQKEFEVTFKDGKLDGLWTRWYENGQMRGEATMKDGKPVTCVAWKPNGKKCPHTNVVDGNGVVVRYNDDGTEAGRYTHKDGKPNSAQVWKPNGKKCTVTNLKNGNGVIVEYKEDGTESGRTTYKDGERVLD